jgi:hypothetical protein
MIPEIAKDLAESSDQLSLMGEKNKEAFISGAIWVKQYNLSIKGLLGMMDKFDTLSAASENVSKLNQMFGITLNSIDMLTDADPAARLEKVQQKLLQAGKSWESMDYFQRKSLASMMGIDATQAQLVFSGKQMGKSRAEIARAMEQEDKKQEESKKRQAEVMKAILQQLRASRGIMGSIMPLFYRLWVAFAQVFRKFLWGLRRGVLDFVDGWAAGVRKLAQNPAWKKMSRDWVIRWRDTMKNFGVEWGKLWSQIDMEKFGKDFYGTIDTAIDAIKQILKDLFPNWAKSAKQGAKGINDIIHGIAVRLQGIIKWVGENGADVIKGIGKVAKAAWIIVKKVFDFFDKSNWGKAADIMKSLFKQVSIDAVSILKNTDGIVGNMTTGLDPAVTTAKILTTAYMGMRNIIIDIATWWKKYGDDIKNTMKTVFELSFKTSKYVGQMLKWLSDLLSKHPALLNLFAVGVAGNFLTRRLGGVGIGQVIGSLFGGSQEAKGKGGKYSSPMPPRRGSLGYYGSKAAGYAGTGLRGMAGGAIGGFVGSSLGQAVGVTRGGLAGTFIGGGAGMGSALGPLGAAGGALAGSVVTVVGELYGLGKFLDKQNAIREDNLRVEAMQVEINKNYFNALNKEVFAIINSKSKREVELEQLSKQNDLLEKNNDFLDNQISIYQSKWTLDDQRLDAELKQAKLNQDKEAIKRIRSEIKFRGDLNTQLEKSALYQKLNAVAELAKIDAEQKRLEAEGQIVQAEDIKRGLEQNRQALIDKVTEQTSLMFDGLPQAVQRYSEGSDFKAGIESVYQRIYDAVGSGQISSQFANEVLQRASSMYKVGVEDAQSTTEMRQGMTDIIGTVNEQIQAGIAKGRFPEAEQLMNDILRSTTMIEKNRAVIANAEARSQKIGLEIARIPLLAAQFKWSPEMVDAYIQSQISRFGSTGSINVPPAMAMGGLVKEATNAIIGEAGPELVVPLRRGPVANTPGSEAIISDYLNRMKGNSSKNEERVIVVPINIDGRKLGAGLVRIANRTI